MFEKVAYERYSGRDVYEWLKHKTNLRSRHGNLLNLSVIYRILNNTYYCGLFEFSGKWYKGSHEPIITRELFDAVQKKMTVAPKSKPGTKQFDFTKLFKCGSCGSGISAQEKFKRYKSGKIVRYVYYHCTQFRDFDCKEPYIREEKLIEQLINHLKGVSVERIQNVISLKPDLDKFMVIKNALNNPNETQPEINISEFIRYIFNQGTKEQRRDLIGCLDKEIYIKDKQVILT
jgi:hypothetical protein